MRSPLILLFLCLPLASQTRPFSFGLTGGVPFGRMTASVPFGPDESRRYTFGTTLEAFLTDRISLNFNPLYRRTGAHYGLVPGSNPIPDDPGSQQVLQNTGRVRSHSLELPVIGKYTLGRPRNSWRPFAGAGFAFQTSWQSIQNRVVVRDSTVGENRTLEAKYYNRSPFDVGAVFSAGIGARRGRIQYAPEIRFTRWGSPNTSHGRSQAEALFTIRF